MLAAKGTLIFYFFALKFHQRLLHLKQWRRWTHLSEFVFKIDAMQACTFRSIHGPSFITTDWSPANQWLAWHWHSHWTTDIFLCLNKNNQGFMQVSFMLMKRFPQKIYGILDEFESSECLRCAVGNDQISRNWSSFFLFHTNNIFLHLSMPAITWQIFYSD